MQGEGGGRALTDEQLFRLNLLNSNKREGVELNLLRNSAGFRAGVPPHSAGLTQPPTPARLRSQVTRGIQRLSVQPPGMPLIAGSGEPEQGDTRQPALQEETLE